MKSFILTLLLLFIHCSAAAAAATVPAPLFSSCAGSTHYSHSHDGSFTNSLSKLMSLLLKEAPGIGFGLGSAGHGEAQAYGIAMCRGDITSYSCTACIHKANDYILRHCPIDREATVWLDQCLVRYADREFFGEIDESKKLYVVDNTNGLKVSALDAKVEELMEKLVKTAYLTPLLFATGEMEVVGEGRLFGLVQCTRDLSGGDCKRCLSDAVNELQSCCNGGRGGRVVGGSCNIRYELYPFYDSN